MKETTKMMKIVRKILLGLLVIAIGIFVFLLLLLAVFHFPILFLVLAMLIVVLGTAYMIGDRLTDFK